MNTTTILIPTYRRPQDLKVCLEALKKQDELPNEVLIIVRDTDFETWKFFEAFDSKPLKLKTVKVIEPGVLEALSTGFKAAQGDIIAITDDDAAPHPDWLARIKAHFLSDSCIGGVGGRDFLYENKTQLVEGMQQVVGKIQWFGNVIGNHHLGVGKAREVDVLKGVNSSYRRIALQDFSFDERLRISGKNTHYELALGLHLKKAGMKIIYDPKITVDHYPGQRFQMANREKFNALGIKNTAYNQALILIKNLSPLQQIVFIIWATLIGTRGRRGLIQCLRFLPREGLLSVQQCVATIQGRWQALHSYYQDKMPFKRKINISTKIN
jgi:cellulose synthase/poly-beta-1,6-N-acetylglucosamine synthase-like glycosyltransferase